MNYVKDQLLIEHQEPVFEVLDFNCLEAYNEQFHTLTINSATMKTRKVGLTQHPFHFHKLLLLMDFIDKNLAKSYSEQDNSCDDNLLGLKRYTIKKRAVYYSLVG